MNITVNDFTYAIPPEKLQPQAYSHDQLNKLVLAGIRSAYYKKIRALLRKKTDHASCKVILDNWTAPDLSEKEKRKIAAAKQLEVFTDDEIRDILQKAGKLPVSAPPVHTPRRPRLLPPPEPAEPQMDLPMDPHPEPSQGPVLTQDEQTRLRMARSRAMAMMRQSPNRHSEDVAVEILARGIRNDPDMEGVVLGDRG